MASSEKDEDTTAKGKELWTALKRDPLDKEQIKLLLQLGAPANFREPDSRKTRFQTGRTPLHYVVFEVDGDEELLEMLLKHGADTNLSDSYDCTPLHLAAEKGNLRAVRKLVNNPYSPAYRNKQNQSGETPAQVAQRKQQENSSPTLLDDKSCETPAQAAQRKQLENVLYYLLNDNTNDEDVSSDGDGNVHVSTSAGSSVTVNSPGGTVHVMVGDGNKMSISK